MKTLMILLVSAAMLSVVNAQDFRAQLNPSQRPPSKGGVPLSKPVPIGMAEAISKYGIDAFNPWAPAYIGRGAVASNIAEATGNQDPEQKNRQAGGIVIFGYLF
jgi:hypothetical protein